MPPALASPVAAVERARAYVAAHPVVAGFALFALACATRLALILTARWTGDEITTWTTARDLVTGKAFPLLGPVITGGEARNPGPLIYYVAALPLLFNPAPEGCNALVAVLGAASVVLYWHALRAYFSETGALLSSVMMACSPWSTLYADRIWNPNVVGFFVALAFWAACRLRLRPSLGAVVTLFVAVGATLQLHMSAPVVWVALLPIFLPSVRTWRWYWPLVGAAAVGVLYAPMLIHELRTGWSNTLAFIHETSTNTSTDYKRVPFWAFRLMTLDISYLQLKGYWYPQTEQAMRDFVVRGATPGVHACPFQCSGHDADFHYGPVRWFFFGLSYLFAACALALAGVRAFRDGARKGPHPFLSAGLVGLAANTALLWVAHKELHGHYVQLMLPFYFVAFAALFDWASERAWTFWLASGALLLVCVGGVDVARWESSTLDARNGLGTARSVIAAVRREDPGATRASITVGYRSLSAERLNWLTGLDKEHPLHFDSGNQYRLLLADAPAPKGTRTVLSLGPVTLYRAQ